MTTPHILTPHLTAPFYRTSNFNTAPRRTCFWNSGKYNEPTYKYNEPMYTKVHHTFFAFGRASGSKRKTLIIPKAFISFTVMCYEVIFLKHVLDCTAKVTDQIDTSFKCERLWCDLLFLNIKQAIKRIYRLFLH